MRRAGLFLFALLPLPTLGCNSFVPDQPAPNDASCGAVGCQAASEAGPIAEAGPVDADATDATMEIPDGGPIAEAGPVDTDATDATMEIPDGRADADASDASDSSCVVLSLSQSQLNLVRNGSTTLAVTVGGSGCTVGTLRFSALPSGVSVDIPDSGATGQLTFRAAPSATLGPAQVRVSAGGASGVPLVLLVEDSPGSVDTTFGDAGAVLVQFSESLGSLTVNAVVATPGGSIFVSGSVDDSKACGGTTCAAVALAKLDSRGVLDSTFGSGGMAVHTGPLSSSPTVPLYLVVAPSGGLFTTGFTDNGRHHSISVGAFGADGKPDPNFGAGGFFVRDVGLDSKSAAAALQPDGKFIVGGYAGSSGALFRTTVRGGLDTSFGEGDAGVATTIGEVFSVGLLSTGSFVAGQATEPITLARYSANGVLDHTYGSSGFATGATHGSISSLVVQPDDQVVIASNTEGDGGTTGPVTLSRFRTDGTLDPSFGIGGIATPAVPAGAVFYALQRAPDGRFAVALSIPPSGAANISVARLSANGALDLSFGGGVVNAGIEAYEGALMGVAVDAYGRILVAGLVVDPNNSTFFEALVVRYWP